MFDPLSLPVGLGLKGLVRLRTVRLVTATVGTHYAYRYLHVIYGRTQVFRFSKKSM